MNSFAEFTDIFDLSDDLYFQIDENFMVTSANQHLIRFLGLTDQSEQQVQLSDFVEPSTLRLITKKLKSLEHDDLSINSNLSLKGSFKKDTLDNSLKSNQQSIEAFQLTIRKNEAGFLILAKSSEETLSAHKAKNEAERNYNTILKHINQGFVFQDTQGLIITANTAAMTILGLDMDQLQGRGSIDPRWKTIYEDGSDFPGEEHPAMQVLQTKESVCGVVMGVYHPISNSHVWIKIDSYPSFNFATQEFLGVNTFFTDITQFKEVKDHSEEQETFLKQLINSSTEVSFISANTDGIITTFNTGAERLLGYQTSEVLGKKSLVDFHSGAELDQRSEEIEETYQVELKGLDVLTYLPYLLEKGEKRKWSYKHKSGRQIPVDVTISAVYNSANELTGYLAIAVDISQEEATKKWNEDLLNELIRFKEGLDQAALVSITDVQGRITFANKRFIEVSEYQYEELFLQNHSIIKSTRHSPEFYKEIWDTITAGKIWTGEICNLSKSGKEYWVASVIVPFTDKNNELTHYLSIRHDITEGKQATLKAQKASLAKSEFLANMSHEIRTPMNGVIGMTDLLLETTLDEEQLDLAKTVKASASSLLDIINDILDFSKIEAGKLDIESTHFELYELCQTVIKVMSFKAEDSDLYCQLKIDSNVPKYVMGDPTRIKQVLINLLGNAIKFTQKGGVVLSVTLDSQTLEIKFEVIDTGIGIPDHLIAKLFDKFTQAETSTTRNFGGTGLGLSISKQLVELMGGQIQVTSEVESGSNFWFELPLKQVNSVESEVTPKTSENISLSDVKILVAEDNLINQKVIKGVLKKFNIKPTFTANGQECIEKLMFEDFDLIFMDMHMPVMDGETATKTIRANKTWDSLPIIAMTANVMNGFKEHCLEIGMDDYVTKPFSKQTIKEVITKWAK